MSECTCNHRNESGDELPERKEVSGVREESVSRGDIFSRLPPHQREVFERMRRGKE